MIKIVSPKKGSNAALIMWLMIVILACTLLMMLCGMKWRHDILTRLDEIEAMITTEQVEQVKQLSAIVERVDHPEVVIEPIPEPVEVPDFSYLRDDIALSHEHQILLHNACEEFDIPFELGLAVVWRETNYVNQSVNDEYFGYMMLAKKWVWPEQEALGVTDLMDPEGNFRIGCCLLRQFIDSKGSVEAALARYSNDYSGWYAESVMSYMDELLS